MASVAGKPPLTLPEKGSVFQGIIALVTSFFQGERKPLRAKP